MATVRTCSWCHEINPVPEDGTPAAPCWYCKHNSALPRVQCDCPQCKRRRAADREPGRPRSPALL